MKPIYLLAVSLVAALVASGSLQAAFSDKTNGEYVTLSGKVTTVRPDSFEVSVNDKAIIVEMDGKQWKNQGYQLSKGDEVIVSGRIDKDFFQRRRLNAGTVYVKGASRYFHGSKEDRPSLSSMYLYTRTLPDASFIDIQGTITEVDGREVTVDTGTRKLRVDTSKMNYNPFDPKGFSKIKKGDRIRASGIIDDDLFEEEEELMARYVEKLN